MRLAGLVLIVAMGCRNESTAVSTVGDMKDAACRGDAQAYMAHVDRSAIARDLSAHSEDDGIRDKLAQDLTPRAIDVLMEWEDKAMRDGITTVVERTMTGIEDDIKRGQASDDCKLQVVGEPRVVDGLTEVTILDVDGVHRLWGFRLSGEHWLLVRTRVAPEDRERVKHLHNDKDFAYPTNPGVPGEVMKRVLETDRAERARGIRPSRAGHR